MTLLRQIEVEIGNGKTAPQAYKEAEITVQTFCFTGYIVRTLLRLYAGRVLHMRQRNLRKQLQIDHHRQAPIQLKKRCRLLPWQRLGHRRHILQSQRLRLSVHLHPVPHINQRILVRHRCPGIRVLLQQCILRVVHFMQVVRVVLVDGPELLRLRIRQ